MNYSTAVMLINPSIRAVKGKYEEGGNTEIFKTIIQDLKIDDFAVVESGTRWNMTTVKIVEVDVEVDFDSSKVVGWVIQKINVRGHEDIKKMEATAIDLIKKGELRKRREDIKKNTLDAFSAGEIDKLDIAKLGGNAITDGTKEQA
jgi:hypothetical protein